MNITFVGGGISSLIASILLKEKYPSIDVTIIEKDETLGKRFKVAGNGRCNFSNSNISSSFFHNGNQVKHIIDQFNLCKDDIYSSLGIYYFIDNYGRYYPLSESGKSLQGLLLKHLESLSIKVINDFIISVDDSSNDINGSILLKSIRTKIEIRSLSKFEWLLDTSLIYADFVLWESVCKYYL